MAIRPRPLSERFWEKVEILGPSDCWPWTAGKLVGGYGQFQLHHRRSAGAHRIAYELTIGDIPAGRFVCHHCDNPPCVNPAHLFLGGAADNVADMVAKGRNARGERNGNATMADSDVALIPLLRASGHTLSAIAGRFGVTRQAVSYHLRKGALT